MIAEYLEPCSWEHSYGCDFFLLTRSPLQDGWTSNVHQRVPGVKLSIGIFLRGRHLARVVASSCLVLLGGPDDSGHRGGEDLCDIETLRSRPETKGRTECQGALDGCVFFGVAVCVRVPQ